MLKLGHLPTHTYLLLNACKMAHFDFIFEMHKIS